MSGHMSLAPRWVRHAKAGASRPKPSRRAAGGCTCLTKELFPSDWARFLLPWFFVTFFAGLFVWVRGWSWVGRVVRLEVTATLLAELGFIVNLLFCVWSLAMVHYYSPGFLPAGLTARSIAIDLEAMRRGETPADLVGSVSSEYHWEMKKYGPRRGQLRTCKRSPTVRLAPLGTTDVAAATICPAKPDRAHFCPFTGRAVLEMDHYCPWLGNCIGHGTRKPFLLTLWYGVMMGLSLFGCISWDLVLAFTSAPRFVAAVPLFVASLLGLVVLFLVAIFLQYHLLLALGNRTTIEDHEKRRAPHALGVPSQLRADLQDLFSRGGSSSDAFVKLSFDSFESEKPAKNSLFVALWSAWAYRKSPWDRSTLDNMGHFLGPFWGAGIPMHTGWTRWRPWAVALTRPADASATALSSKPAAKPLDDKPGLGPRDPVGAAPHSLLPREALTKFVELRSRRLV